MFIKSNASELLELHNSKQIDVSTLPSVSYNVKINVNEITISKNNEIIR